MMMLVSFVSTSTDGLNLLSLGSEDRHVSHSHPIVGTPEDVPLPSTVTLITLSSTPHGFSEFLALR